MGLGFPAQRRRLNWSSELRFSVLRVLRVLQNTIYGFI